MKIENHKREKIIRELTELINKNSLEHYVDLKDWIIAEMMISQFENLSNAIDKKELLIQIEEAKR